MSLNNELQNRKKKVKMFAITIVLGSMFAVLFLYGVGSFISMFDLKNKVFVSS